MNTKKAALIIMHCQNDIVHPDGLYRHAGVYAQVEKITPWILSHPWHRRAGMQEYRLFILITNLKKVILNLDQIIFLSVPAPEILTPS